MSDLEYHPQAKAIIDMINSGSAPPASDPAERLAGSRAGYTGWWSLNGPGPEIGEVRDIQMLRDDGPPIPARVYKPTEDGDAPILVFFHGGGMVIGSMNDYDGVCRSLADASGAVVVNVDYRLAPENEPPAQIDDAYDAMRWAAEHAADLGGSAAKLIVCGDSAGGNLAAICALRARDDGDIVLALQMLLYPVVDWAGTFPSIESNGTGNFLTKETMEWFRANYLGDDPSAWTDPAVSPWYVEDLSGICPAWVMTTSHDPLRDEGVAYAQRLEDAGVPTTHIEVDGVFHAFFGQTNLLELAVTALADAAAAIKGA
jgi:acetyl esterase